jgi:hypothetical protein
MYAKAVKSRSLRSSCEDSLITVLAGRRHLFRLLGGIVLAFFSLNVQAENFSGVVEVAIAENGEDKTFEEIYELKTLKNGKVIRKRLKSGKVKLKGGKVKLKPGDIVQVSGDAGADSIIVNTIEVQAASGAPAIDGDRTTLGILVGANDSEAVVTAAELTDYLFQARRSVDGVYDENSLGHIQFSGQVVGPYYKNTSGADCSSEGNGMWDWVASMEAQIIAGGIDISRYKHLLFIMPPNSTCIGTGYAYFNNPYAFVKPQASWGPEKVKYYIAHELGHNLAMSHAGYDPNNDGIADSEYGDQSDNQGNPQYQMSDWNAPNTDYMGFLSDYPHKIVTKEAGYFEVEALEAPPGDTLMPQIIKFPKPDRVANEWYYISFRQPDGYSDTLQNHYTTGISIHTFIDDGSIQRTRIIDLLQPGEVFYDQVNKIAITATSQSLDGMSMGFWFESTVGIPLVTNVGPSPVELSISTGKRGRQNLWWSSADASEVSHYEVIRNGATIVTTENTAYEDRSVSKGNTYSYVVVAVNAAGLRSEDSNTVTVDLSSDSPKKGRGSRKYLVPEMAVQSGS